VRLDHLLSREKIKVAETIFTSSRSIWHTFTV
jgi:hypothetical protein